MKAALIATGDEVVSGQIINTNASYLASRLSEIGVEVVGHFAVLDREESLKEIFDHLSHKNTVDVALTIGGLGPTRDDLTRQVIANYSDQKLQIDESLWSDMKCSLIKRQIQPRKGHKWQCFFPQGAKIFKNLKGTAQSFLTESKNLKIIALPGPPSELKSVLDDGGLIDWFKERSLASVKLMSWQCINVPESELAYEVENALEGCDYQIGYRASPPITEVKMWVDKSDKDKEKWIKKMDDACEPTLYSKNAFSYVNAVLKSMGEVSIIDKVTKGYALDEIKKIVEKETLNKLSYAYGSSFKSDKESFVFFQDGEEFSLIYGDRAVEFSLEGKKLFRSKRSSIYAFLMLFKEFYYKFLLN